MKKLSIILLLIATSTSLIGQNLQALDFKYGFRGAKFEMPFDSLKNLVEVEKDFYKSTNEDLKIGNYILDEVIYHFYKGQLSLIIIKTKGYTNSVGFLKILQEAYGKGYQENEYIEKYYWFGEKVRMSYDQNSITDDADIYISSKKLTELERAEQKQAQAEAAKQL